MTAERIEPNFSNDSDAVVTYSRVSASTPNTAIDAGLVDEKIRPGAARFFLFGAAFSVLAGGGILAVAMGVAPFLSTGEPAAELTREASEPEAILTGVRQIPLPTSVSTPSGLVMPPIPRQRPETITAVFQPEQEAQDAAPVLVSTDTADFAEPPITKVETVAVPSAPIQTPASEPDSVISGIEDALARIDAAALTDPSGQNGNATVPVLPPPVASLPAPNPPVGDAYPPNLGEPGPYYEILPPPAANNSFPVDGYPSGPSYVAGPIPPEAIPYVHNSIEDAGPDNRRPGIVRRTIDRTNGVLARVLRPGEG